MASVQIYFRDHGNQQVTTGIPVQITATDPEKAALVDAIQLWSIGENDGADELKQIEARIGVGATSPLAQSGVWAYAELKDNVVGSSYLERIPMPDLAKAVDTESDIAWNSVQENGKSISVINTSHNDWATLKAAFEAAYISPNGNTATLVRVYVPNKL